MAAETKGFTIEGEVCEFVTIDEFALDEAQVLYDNTGLTVFDLLTDDDEQEELLEEKLKNPGFVRSLMHVAYQRKHPDVPAKKVKALIAKQSLVAALADLYERANAEDDALPPASTTEHEPSSLRSSVGSSETSGRDSSLNSDDPVVLLEPITTTGSDTSLAASLRGASAL